MAIILFKYHLKFFSSKPVLEYDTAQLLFLSKKYSLYVREEQRRLFVRDEGVGSCFAQNAAQRYSQVGTELYKNDIDNLRQPVPVRRQLSVPQSHSRAEQEH